MLVLLKLGTRNSSSAPCGDSMVCKEINRLWLLSISMLRNAQRHKDTNNIIHEGNTKEKEMVVDGEETQGNMVVRLKDLLGTK